MSVLTRVKRVTDPLDDSAKQRLVGQLDYSSSGSEHSGDDSLSDLVDDFFLDLESESDQNTIYDSESDRVDSVSDCIDQVEDAIKSALNNKSDSYRNVLYGDVMRGVEMCCNARNVERIVIRRKVMSYLRELGHNAAICKTKWDTCGNLTAGNYEFIGVVHPASSTWQQNRYIVDLDFASQFEIARPTQQYKKITRCLPRVFVGKSEDLRRIVRATCDAVKRSLKCNNLTLPLWRKNRYMQNKWFIFYFFNFTLIFFLSSPASLSVTSQAIAFLFFQLYADLLPLKVLRLVVSCVAPYPRLASESGLVGSSLLEDKVQLLKV